MDRMEKKFKFKPTKKNNVFEPMPAEINNLTVAEARQAADDDDCLPMGKEEAAARGVSEDMLCKDQKEDRMLSTSNGVCIRFGKTNGADHDFFFFSSGQVSSFTRDPNLLGASCTIYNNSGSYWKYIYCTSIPRYSKACVVYSGSGDGEVLLYQRNRGYVRPIFYALSSDRYFDPISHSIGPSAQYHENSYRFMERAWTGSSDWDLIARFNSKKSQIPKTITHHCAPGNTNKWTYPHGHPNVAQDHCLPGQNRRLALGVCTILVTLTVEVGAEVVMDIVGDILMETVEGEELIVMEGEQLELVDLPPINSKALVVRGTQNIVGEGRIVQQGTFVDNQVLQVKYGFDTLDEEATEYITHRTTFANGQVGVPHDIALNSVADAGLSSEFSLGAETTIAGGPGRGLRGSDGVEAENENASHGRSLTSTRFIYQYALGTDSKGTTIKKGSSQFFTLEGPY